MGIEPGINAGIIILDAGWADDIYDEDSRNTEGHSGLRGGVGGTAEALRNVRDGGHGKEHAGASIIIIRNKSN